MVFVGTRRDVLRRGAAAIGAATIAGSAGCMGLLGGGGGDYTEWLPEPGSIGEREHYRVTVLRLESLASHEAEFDDRDLDEFEARWAPASVDWEDVTTYLEFGGMTVVQADFEKEAILEDYEDEDYDDGDEYEGYTLMSGPRERMIAAVGDDALIVAGGGDVDVEDPGDAVVTVIDTKNGDEDRYTGSDHFTELVDRTGVGDVVRGSSFDPVEESAVKRGRFENQVAGGERWSVEDGETSAKRVVVFESEDDVAVDDVEEWVEASQGEADGAFSDWDDVEVNGKGRSVVVEGTVGVEAMAVFEDRDSMWTGEDSDYTRWIPEPGTIREEDHYSIDAFDLESMAEHEEEFDETVALDRFENLWAPAEVDWVDVELFLRFSAVSVVEADLEQREVVETYEDEGYSETDEHRGYVILTGPDDELTAAIGDDALVLSGDGVYNDVSDPVNAVETVIDTRTGDEPRYVDESDDFGDVADTTGGGDFVRSYTARPTEETVVERGEFENQVAQGQRWTVEGERTYGKWVLVFESEEDATVDDVEKWVAASRDEADGEFEDWEAVEVKRNGRRVIVTATTDTEDL